jgi:predicted phosphate transport protein (TIGR00153 family)
MLGPWKRAHQVERLVFEHWTQVRRTIDLFLASARAYFSDKDGDEADRLALETHRAEGAADDIRRKVEQTLISGALLAPSRRQILEIIERVDTLANAAEATLDYLLVQRVDVPPEIVPDLREILDATSRIVDDVECVIHALFAGERDKSTECLDRIDKGESQVDHLERKATKALFALGLEMGRKLHVFGLIDNLVTISDRAEDLADRIALVIAERAF